MIKDTYGHTGKIIRVNLSSGTWRTEERDAIFWRRYIGGGLLATALLIEKCSPGIDPLSPDNLLIFTSSVIAGQSAPGLARFTTAAKSPLTGGIGETRTEGPWGVALKSSGANTIVFEGRSREPAIVLIDNGHISFHDAKKLWGKTVGETVDAMEEKFGKDVHVAAIGPAGEKQVRFASIVTDRTFQAARMGMGAVMGSKNLKAVVLKGGTLPQIADKAGAEKLKSFFESRIIKNDLSRWQYEPPGFSCWLYLHGLDAALCVRNYSASTITETERFKKEEFLRRYNGYISCPGCPNRCIKILHPLNSQGLDIRASGIHQEVSGTMGPNLGIVDLDWILSANNFCNQQGMDPVSLGFTLSFAMELFEKGLLGSPDSIPVKFGDKEGVSQLMENIVCRRGLGNILAEGTRRASKQFGQDCERYAMHVKGLEMVCFEPRSQTNLALGYAIAPIGPRYDICEHDWDFDTKVGWEHSLNLSRTLGILTRIPMNYIGPEKVRNFKSLLTLWSAADSLDLCIFAIAPTRILSLHEITTLVGMITGWEFSSYEMMKIGERRLHLMRWYNVREGLEIDNDILPERFYTEPVADGPRKGDIINKSQFTMARKMFYEMMGWDKYGIPAQASIYDAGLEQLLDSQHVK
ncbi:MAG: hypothetical protein M1501_01715 [Candidatus Omnitrophica bacterium]|nr:hypothetical protein [Candidatus Omnitrophota bacterium]